MIVQHFLLSILFIYRQILLIWGQELYLADALAHAPNHLLVRLKEKLDFTAIEAACSSYRCQGGPGCPPTYPISLLVRAILVGWLFGLSLRQLEERLHYDLIARWFVGCQGGDPLPDHSTLGRFELWLVCRHPDLFFSTFLSQVDRYFPHERRAIQIGDTYAMLAWAADEGLVTRIRHVCLRLTMELKDSFPAKFDSHWHDFDWPALYGTKPEKPSGLIDQTARQQRLQRTVLAALDFRQRVEGLLIRYDNQHYSLLRAWCAHLDKVLADEVLIQHDETGLPLKVTELPNKDKGDFRLISATDPDATLRMHGETEQDISLGYNIQVAATPSGFIRETRAYTGADPDQSGIAPLIAAQKIRQENASQPLQLPPKLIYDMAAGSGKTRCEVQQVSAGKTQLVAKQLPYDKRCQRFGPYNFSLSQDGRSLTCPNGQTSSTAYRSQSGDGRDFRFYADKCWQGPPPNRMNKGDLACRCPLWEQCRDNRQGPRAMRQVFISDYRQQVLDAAAYNQTEAFQLDMHQRPLIERIIFELTHYNGARHCRRRGLPAADFQAKMCATAYNLKLLVRKFNRAQPGQSAPAQAG